MEVPAASLTEQTEPYDVCIVGAGPVGISIALRLADTPLRVLLLESGGHRPTYRAQALNRGDVVGRDYWPLDRARHRQFGGSGNWWGGMCRPLDRADFAARDWVEGSGWPISADEVAGYYPGAAEILGLDPGLFEVAGWDGALPSTPLVDKDRFDAAVFQYSPTANNFGSHHRERIRTAPNVVVALGANVVGFRLDDRGVQVREVRVALDARRRVGVRARRFVLAAGGIENARLLLAARSRHWPDGLGNRHDNVGCHFMEHVQVLAAHYAPAGPALERSFFDVAHRAGVTVRGVLVGAEEAQREHRLLACSIAVEPRTFKYGQPLLDIPTAVAVPAERAHRWLRADRPKDRPDAVGLRERVERSWYALKRLDAYRAARASQQGTGEEVLYSLYLRGEQVPQRSSRITLGEETDRFGIPRVRLRWQLADQDIASLHGWLRVFGDSVAERGLGRMIPLTHDLADGIHGGPHHLGATRMSADPRAGVVDPDSAVHGVPNLFVAGTSVFPNGGHANPTFTAIALGLRLADHLVRTAPRPPAGMP